MLNYRGLKRRGRLLQISPIKLNKNSVLLIAISVIEVLNIFIKFSYDFHLTFSTFFSYIVLKYTSVYSKKNKVVKVINLQ